MCAVCTVTVVKPTVESDTTLYSVDLLGLAEQQRYVCQLRSVSRYDASVWTKPLYVFTGDESMALYSTIYLCIIKTTNIANVCS
jgi:hypothetical protein